ADYSPERDAGPIAEHLAAAGREAEAIEPALRAAADAYEVDGNVEAYYYYSLALRALPDDDPRRFDALLRRERILRAWGRRRAQVADIRELLRHAEQRAEPPATPEGDHGVDPSGDPIPLAIASIRLLRFYLEVGRPQPAERLLPRVLERVSAVPNPAPFQAVVAELRRELAF